MTQDESVNDEVIKVDIAIVGAGMIGSAIARSLKDTRFDVALIDSLQASELQKTAVEQVKVSDFSPRVSAITPLSKRLLDELDAWKHIPKVNVAAYQKMHVWDQLGTGVIDFDSAELYQDNLGFIVENQNIISALHKSLQGQNNVQHFYGNSLERLEVLPDVDHQHILSLSNGKKIHCQLLIAADGANSRIRTWAGMATREWDYQHNAIVATIKTTKKHQQTAWQRFSATGPLAFLPLQDANQSQKYCSIVWSQAVGEAAELMSLDDESFAKKLSVESEGILGDIESVSKRHSFPLRQRHAKSYTKDGVVLVGDAAHTIHPLAGQGVNQGFKDVKALCKLLLKANEQELDVNDPVLLRRYQRQRQGDNLMMMGVMEGFKRLFEAPQPAFSFLRNVGLTWVDKQAFIKNKIIKQAMGI